VSTSHQSAKSRDPLTPDVDRPLDSEADHKVYLEYLDKEMTIMGVLSVFSVAAPAFILDRTFGASPSTMGARLWFFQEPTVALATIAFLLAALFFYRQRSDLALWYGQIALSMTPSAYGKPTTKEFIHDADRWSGWRQYYRAFACLTASVTMYALALYADYSHMESTRALLLAAVLGFAVGIAHWVRMRVFRHFDDAYDPWACWGEEGWKSRFVIIYNPIVRPRVYDACSG
jgi:hypothetical protein